MINGLIEKFKQMVKRTQTIEVIGVGNFNIYPIKVKENEYNKVSKNGLILNKKILEPSKPSKYVYVDDGGIEYPNDKVMVDFNGVQLQQIKRTDKVKNFEIVDRNEYSTLTEYNISFLDTDETTLRIFDEKVGDKAISFKLKKSTIGFNFWRAYILKINNILVMVNGKGNLIKAIQEFKDVIENKKEIKTEIVVQKVEVSQDEIEGLIEV